MADAKKEVPKTEVVDWQKQLGDMAIAVAAAEKPSGNWVSFKSGMLSIGGNHIKTNKIDVVVVQSIFENQWYKERYDSANPQTPHCFAFAELDDDLKPHEDSAEPQAATCAECPKNIWGSDPDGGKGKACKNVRRLAMVAAADLDTVKDAAVALAKLPVMSVKNWSAYANQIANVLKVPPLAVITNMSVTPDVRSQFVVNFELVDKITDGAVIQSLLQKRKDIQPLIFAGYDKPTEAVAATEPRKF